jgi:hypothetical protein
LAKTGTVEEGLLHTISIDGSFKCRYGYLDDLAHLSLSIHGTSYKAAQTPRKLEAELRHELGRRFLILKYPNANPLMSETVGIWGVFKLLKEISLFGISAKIGRKLPRQNFVLARPSSALRDVSARLPTRCDERYSFALPRVGVTRNASGSNEWEGGIGVYTRRVGVSLSGTHQIQASPTVDVNLIICHQNIILGLTSPILRFSLYWSILGCVSSILMAWGSAAPPRPLLWPGSTFKSSDSVFIQNFEVFELILEPP